MTKIIIALLILNTSVFAHNLNSTTPSPEVLSVENGILHLKTTLVTGEIVFSYGTLDNIDLPTIKKNKTLRDLIMDDFYPVPLKYPNLQVIAGKIVSSYIERVTVKQAIEVEFTLHNSYWTHSEKVSRNPITINYKESSDLGEDLVTMGFAHDWSGGRRQKWTKVELLHIINSTNADYKH